MDAILNYTGSALRQAQHADGTQLAAYLPDATLVEAVNLALLLRRPLLLMGDPGCGKTRLAEAVAYELYGEGYRNHYYRWDVKSTSQAKDGLYRYDSIGRLRDAQVNSDRSKFAGHYITLAELGKAFVASTPQKPAVLLIDEIDKADIDFPNDLLLELDKHQFRIEETGQVITAPHPPVIFITSNGEKELPAAFLRRCLYHHIPFPSKTQLTSIVRTNFKDLDEQVADRAIELFRQAREEMDLKFSGAEKKVSTSELLDWVRVIDYYHTLRKGNAPLTGTQQQFVAQLDQLEGGRIPFRQVLLKNFESHVSIMADGNPV